MAKHSRENMAADAMILDVSKDAVSVWQFNLISQTWQQLHHSVSYSN